MYGTANAAVRGLEVHCARCSGDIAAYADLAFPTSDPLEELPLGNRLASLPRNDPSLGPVCSMVADETVEVRGGLVGALFDVSEPVNVNNGDLQAALKRLPGGNPCNGIEIMKLEIRLQARLAEVTSQLLKPNAQRVRSSNSDPFQAIDFQFKLVGVDVGYSPARSQAIFKFMASESSDSRRCSSKQRTVSRDFALDRIPARRISSWHVA